MKKSKHKFSRLYSTILIYFLIITPFFMSCGGGGGGGSDDNNVQQQEENTTDDTSNNLAHGLIIETDDPDNPYMTIGNNGNIVSFEVNPATNKPTGITIITSDGKEGYLAIDEDSGMPDYWVASGIITVFSNMRPAEGLIDVHFIYDDGTTETVQDFNYGEWITPSGTSKGVEATRMAAATVVQSSDDDAPKRKKFLNFISALDSTFAVTACIGGAILTGGSAFAGVTFPPAGVPLFATTAAATAGACSTAFVKFMALNSNNAKMALVNDTIGLPDTVAGAVANCLTKPGVLMCIKSTADVAGFAASGLVKAVTTTYIQLRDGRARMDQKHQWAYCCNGPSQIKRRTGGSWQAGVDPLYLDKSPYQFHFYVSDFSSPKIRYSDDFLYTASHEFRDEGSYTIEVKVFDDSNNSAMSNKFPVEVYGDLRVTCNTSSVLKVNKKKVFDLPFSISGGKKPFSYTVDLNNGVTQAGKSVKREVKEKVTFAKAEQYNIFLEVTDDDGSKAKCSYYVDILETDRDGDGYDSENSGGNDCDDNDPDTYPGANEVCDGKDNNCDVQIDEGFDNDYDNYTTCKGDCNDTDNSIYPGAPEIPNDGIDQNCDGDDGINEYVVWYTDNVRCWGAPFLKISSRDNFERTEYRCNYSGGGIDCTQELVKSEIQGGFSTWEDASNWICPEITGAHFSYWCGGSRAHWIVSGQELDFRLGNLGCGDLSHLPDVPYPDPHPGM